MLRLNMSKTAKVLLGVAIGCLIVGGVINIGWVNPGKLDALYVLLPVGAVFLGLFLIVLILQRESMAHQEDHHLPEAANEGSAKPLTPDGKNHSEMEHSGAQRSST